MKREHLRKIVNPAVRDRGQLEAHYTWFVTDDELASIGYVLFDDALIERIVQAVDNCFEPAIQDMQEGTALLDDIEREVRLAIMQEGGYI